MPVMPMARAAARERSITRPLVNGPRSVIFTVTARPLRRFTTSTFVPNGRVRWPAVKAPASKTSPLAVRFFRSYQAASPRPSARFGERDRGGRLRCGRRFVGIGGRRSGQSLKLAEGGRCKEIPPVAAGEDRRRPGHLVGRR